MTSSADNAETPRRMTRVRWEIPIRVTSLNAGHPFAERGQTLVVNPQGCGVRLSCALEVGTAVQLDGLPGVGSVTARVANCLALGTDGKFWLVGLALNEPGNVWGVQSPPADWGTASARILPSAATPDPKKKQNWPYSQFSRKGEFHPGRK